MCNFKKKKKRNFESFYYTVHYSKQWQIELTYRHTLNKLESKNFSCVYGLCVYLTIICQTICVNGINSVVKPLEYPQLNYNDLDMLFCWCIFNMNLRRCQIVCAQPIKNHYNLPLSSQNPCQSAEIYYTIEHTYVYGYIYHTIYTYIIYAESSRGV